MTATVTAGMHFFKLQALGNDFVLVDARLTPFAPTPESIVRIADRRTGVGFDQMLILRPADDGFLADVEIFNADGSRAEQCGNGMRAIAAWLDGRGALAPGTRLVTPAGPVELSRHAEHGYTAALPPPRALDPEALDLSAPRLPESATDWALVSLGNPHLILNWNRPPSAADLARTVAILEDGPWRERVNIGLMHAASDDLAVLRVHERGAGPTLACGSAACAAAWALRRLHPADAPVAVDQPGGTLVVDLASRAGHVVSTGPASVVFEGTLA